MHTMHQVDLCNMIGADPGSGEALQALRETDLLCQHDQEPGSLNCMWSCMVVSEPGSLRTSHVTCSDPGSPGSLLASHVACSDPGSLKCVAPKSHSGSSLVSTTPGVRLVGPRLGKRKKFRGRPSGLGPRPTPQFCWGSEFDSSPMAPLAVADGHTITICSLGVNNAEQIAGIAEDPILPGRSGKHYYTQPEFGDRCALVAEIAQGDSRDGRLPRSQRPSGRPHVASTHGHTLRECGCMSRRSKGSWTTSGLASLPCN